MLLSKVINKYSFQSNICSNEHSFRNEYSFGNERIFVQSFRTNIRIFGIFVSALKKVTKSILKNVGGQVGSTNRVE